MVGRTKCILKIFFIGVMTTFSRIIGQLLIPPGEQSVLPSSVFVINGTMPLAFSVYGVSAYSLIAAMFLLVHNQLSGSRVVQGLKYSVACSLIWIVYLLEPLRHAAPLDRITYPLADTFSLLVMGALVGRKYPWEKRGKKGIAKRQGTAVFRRLSPSLCCLLSGG